MVAANKLVEIDDAALKSPSEGTTNGSEVLVGRCLNAAIVYRDLGGFCLIECMKQTPNVGLLRLSRAVACAIREKRCF